MSAQPAALSERRVHVGQGEQCVSGDPEVVLSTLLGSCVAACIRDPIARVGGMNHFLLPSAPGSGGNDNRYGVQAMELLINALLRAGAARGRLEAKVFGGGRMTQGFSDIGGKNAEFVRRFLKDEDIPIVAESLGGDQARRVHFSPVTGEAAQQRVVDPTVADRERELLARKPVRDAGGELELFG